MKLSPSEQESIVTLLTRIYGDIRDIEEEFHLLVGEGDFRPRIEYFHDAVRAFTAQDAKSFKTDERLSVELLAYDLACLRYIGSKPLAPFKPHGDILSPSTKVMVTENNNQLAVTRQRPDRVTRDRIVDLYQHYAVLFAALLKPFADRDYHSRVDDLDKDVEDLQDVIKELSAIAKNKGSQSRVGEAITNIDDNSLRHELTNFMHKQNFKKKDHLEKLVKFLKAQAAKKDKEIAAINDNHMNYVLSQLGIFEDSKDMIKAMAKQGMNLVGKFVEASIAESRRDVTR